VAHKKEIKLIEFKNIGSTMGVIYVGNRNVSQPLPLNKEACLLASQLFEGRDEQKGEQYFFLPYFSPKTLAEKNTILTQLGIEVKLHQSEKGILESSLKNNITPRDSTEILSFFF
jgi:hypothetical protein